MSHLILASNIFLRTGKSGLEILRDISLTLNENDFILLRGSGGSGKTRLLDILSLRIKPSSGTLEYKDRSVKELSRAESEKLKANIGYAGENPTFLENRNIYYNIEFILKLQAVPDNVIFDRIMHIIKLTGLISKRDMLPAELSSSERKLLSLAMVLAREVDILLCDFNIGGFEDEQKIIEILKNVAYCGSGVIATAREDVKIDSGAIKYIDIINGQLK